MSDTTNKTLRRVYEAIPKMQRAKVARTIDREEERAQKVLERISDKLGLK